MKERKMDRAQLKARLFLLARQRLAALPGALEKLEFELFGPYVPLSIFESWDIRMDRIWLTTSAFVRVAQSESVYDDALIGEIDKWASKYRIPTVHPLIPRSDVMAVATISDEQLSTSIDTHIDATHWFKQPSVSPRDAAMLLCNANPEDSDIIDGVDEQLGTHEYEALLQAFENLKRAAPKARTLMEWRTVAREHRLTYHEWIDVWVDLLRRELDEALGGYVSSDAPAARMRSSDTHPWDVEDPRDPPPKYSWYPAVRFLARQFVREDATLLLKRDLLLEKVAACLKKAGRKKRGGCHDFQASTLRKALSNVRLD